MITTEVYDQLVALLGSDAKVKAAIQLMDRRITTKALTEQQQRVYDYLCGDGPVITQRQLAEACGLDHPQKLAAITAALVIKGCLVPANNTIDKA